MAEVTESFVAFPCAGDTCVGVVSKPSLTSEPALGVVIVVGGPQYRAGSHRQFVLLAREVAATGFPVLRFDHRGMGDSDGAMRTFEDVHDDIFAAIGELVRASGVRSVVLWGLCDGASAALMYAPSDPRVLGIIAVNPWVRSPAVESSARLRHYYLRRLISRDFWSRLARGDIDVRRSATELRDAMATASAGDVPPFLVRLENAWRTFRGRVLFVLSGRDFTAREFEQWVRADAARTRLLDSTAEVWSAATADHTFSSRSLRDGVAAKSVQWIATITPGC